MSWRSPEVSAHLSYLTTQWGQSPGGGGALPATTIAIRSAGERLESSCVPMWHRCGRPQYAGGRGQLGRVHDEKVRLACGTPLPSSWRRKASQRSLLRFVGPAPRTARRFPVLLAT